MNATGFDAVLDGLADAIAARVAARLNIPRPAAEQATERKPDFVSEIEVARRTGISRRTLQGWRGAGRGPRWVKVGRAVRYPLPDLEAFMANRS